MDKTIRLQKYLADRGVASRRASEQLIRDGRVSINGRVAELGESVRPGDKVSLDGKPVRSEIRRPTYFILYKPRGVVTTLSDELGRKCVRDLISSVSARVFPVGRLDKDSEGLLLLTNNGENRILMSVADVIDTYVYRVGIKAQRFSFATAAGVFKSVINIIMLLAANGISRKLGDVSLW